MTEQRGEERIRRSSLRYWSLVRQLGLARIVFSWDFLAAAVLSTAATIGMVAYVGVSTQVALAGDALAVVAALLGVIIAGFAIVAALLSDKYSELLFKSQTSPIGILQHFLLIAGLMVASIVTSLAFRTTANTLIHHKHPLPEHVLLGVSVFLLLWSLFYVIELIKLVLGVAITNIEYQFEQGRSSKDGQSGEPPS